MVRAWQSLSQPGRELWSECRPLQLSCPAQPCPSCSLATHEQPREDAAAAAGQTPKSLVAGSLLLATLLTASGKFFSKGLQAAPLQVYPNSQLLAQCLAHSRAQHALDE